MCAYCCTFAVQTVQLARELQHETRVLAKLNHTGILTLIGYTAEPAQIVLEALEGTVYDLVSGGGVETCDGGLLGPLSDILSGCAYLHALATPILRMPPHTRVRRGLLLARGRPGA